MELIKANTTGYGALSRLPIHDCRFTIADSVPYEKQNKQFKQL
jgi:hypothetical protein